MIIHDLLSLRMLALTQPKVSVRPHLLHYRHHADCFQRSYDRGLIAEAHVRSGLVVGAVTGGKCGLCGQSDFIELQPL